ncbi:hypothetical protein BH10PLA2_BH10PLA2_04080 [soil metagenome]
MNFKSRFFWRPRFLVPLFFLLGLFVLLLGGMLNHLGSENGATRIFLDLHEGMTFQDARKVFSAQDERKVHYVEDWVNNDPMPKEGSYTVLYSDSEWIPATNIQLDFVDGQVKRKHIFGPGVGSYLRLWQRRLSPF